MRQIKLVAIAEAAREHHHETSGWADQGFAEYAASTALFKAALSAAYPELDTEALYSMWVDGMESCEYNARLYLTNPEYWSTFRV